MDQDDENGIFIEIEEDTPEPSQTQLQEMYEYTPRDLTEFLFRDSEGEFTDLITVTEKNMLFDRFIEPMI
jgi:hypothetical protein